MVTGKCSLRGGVRILFPHSGVGVLPYEASTHDAMNDWRRLRSEVSLEAGEHILQNVENNEPAHLVAGGNVINRYLYKDGSVELKEDRAQLNLRDVVQQYKDVRITASYEHDEFTLRDVVEGIFETANEKITTFGAVTGVKTDTTSMESHVQYESQIDRLQNLDIPALWEGSTGGYDWDEDTVVDALNEVSKDNGVDYTTTREGWFVMGNTAFTKPLDNSMHLITGDSDVDAMRLREYNVSQTGKKIGKTSAKGAVITGSDVFDMLVQETDRNLQEQGHFVNAELRPYAAVSVEGVDGTEKSTQQLNGNLNLRETAGAAIRDLFNSWGGYTNGNIVFNAGTSTTEGQERLSHMDPGDVIEVIGNQRPGNDDFEADPDSLCGHRIYPGRFSVSSVKHKMNDRVGWETMVETSLLPPNYKTNTIWIEEHTQNVYDDLYQFLDQYRADEQSSQSAWENWQDLDLG